MTTNPTIRLTLSDTGALVARTQHHGGEHTLSLGLAANTSETLSLAFEALKSAASVISDKEIAGKVGTAVAALGSMLDRDVSALAAMHRILTAQLQGTAEIGTDGNPTQAQLDHWRKHEGMGLFGSPDKACKFCVASGATLPPQPQVEKVNPQDAINLGLKARGYVEGVSGRWTKANASPITVSDRGRVADAKHGFWSPTRTANLIADGRDYAKRMAGGFRSDNKVGKKSQVLLRRDGVVVRTMPKQSKSDTSRTKRTPVLNIRL